MYIFPRPLLASSQITLAPTVPEHGYLLPPSSYTTKYTLLYVIIKCSLHAIVAQWRMQRTGLTWPTLLLMSHRQPPLLRRNGAFFSATSSSHHECIYALFRHLAQMLLNVSQQSRWSQRHSCILRLCGWAGYCLSCAGRKLGCFPLAWQ